MWNQGNSKEPVCRWEPGPMRGRGHRRHMGVSREGAKTETAGRIVFGAAFLELEREREREERQPGVISPDKETPIPDVESCETGDEDQALQRTVSLGASYAAENPTAGRPEMLAQVLAGCHMLNTTWGRLPP